MDFFGRPACSNKGLALLARSTGVPVIPYHNWRADDGKFDVYFGQELPLVKTEDKTKDTWRNTQNYTKVLEGHHPPKAGAMVLAAPAMEDQAKPALAKGEALMRPLDPAGASAHLGAGHQLGGRRGDDPASLGRHAPCLP